MTENPREVMMSFMDIMDTRKIQLFEKNPASAPPTSFNLFCLPFSGGNSYSYRGLEQAIAEFIKPVPIELPGHGRRLRIPLLTNIPAMVADGFRQIQSALHLPYALYGHSLGALLGYRLCRQIARANLPKPLHLFVSGRPGPSVPSKEENLHLLPDAEFIAKVMAYGGMPDAVAAEKDLMALFLPILRADFQAITEYRYEKEAPLDIPITVMIGLAENITPADALKWQEVTTQRITLKQFPGNHFFIFQHFPAIGALISETLAQAVAQKNLF